MANKNRKDAQHHWSLWKCNLTAMIHHYTPMKRTKPQPPLKKLTIPITGENEDSHSLLGGWQNGVTTLGKLNHLPHKPAILILAIYLTDLCNYRELHLDIIIDRYLFIYIS